MKMTKSLSVLKGIAALLLVQHGVATHAEAPPWRPVTFTASKSGWMNLREINSSVAGSKVQHWYACGQDTVISFFPVDEINPNQRIEIFGNKPEGEFEGRLSYVRSTKEFVKDADRRSKFLATASVACSSPANVAVPPWMNVSASADRHFYLLPRDFQVNGANRTFWLNGHPSRKVSAHFKANSDGSPLPEWMGGPWEMWLVKFSRDYVARIEINCSSSQMRTLYDIEYDDGGNIKASRTRPSDYGLIPPGTVADGWREVVCLIK